MRSYTRRWDGSTWSPWEWLGGVLTSDPVLIAFGGRLYCFGRGTDRRVYQNVYGGSWSGWQPLGGSRHLIGRRRGDLLGAARVRAGDRQCAVDTSDDIGGGYSGWEMVSGLSIASDPVAVADGADVSLFAKGGDGILRHVRRSAGGWGSWESLELPIKADPAAVSDGTSLWVFAQGTDDLVHVRRRQTGVWGAWEPSPASPWRPSRGNS